MRQTWKTERIAAGFVGFVGVVVCALLIRRFVVFKAVRVVVFFFLAGVVDGAQSARGEERKTSE